MENRGFILIVFIAMFLVSMGCAGPTQLEMDYGTAFKLAKFNQILNPKAEKNLEPVVGFDGMAAKITIDRYLKEFEKPVPPPTYILGIGK
jgi:hypothetical protein